jgi:hypothetical protein
MSGKAGRSGRKSFYDEKEIAEVVNMSVRTVKMYLNDEGIPLEKKVLVAQGFALKRMPTKIEGEGISDKNFIVIRAGQSDRHNSETASEARPIHIQ